MKLFHRELGEGNQPLIVLHGVFGSSDNWITPAKMMADRYKIFLLDQRNHGHSPKSNEFNNEVMAIDLKNFIEENKIENPIIIGHSMGGKVAMTFAYKFPTKLKKLVVVDIAPKYYPPHHQQILEGLHSIDLTKIQSRQDADEQLSKFIPEMGVRQFLLKNLYRNDNNEFDWRINLPIISENIHNVGEPLDENVRIQTPTLFIKGANSNYIKEKDEVLIRSIFSNVSIKTIQGAGHWVQAEKPKEFVEIVIEFLKNNSTF